MSRCILIATGNPGKLREIQAVMDDLPVDWSVLSDHPPMPEPVEDGETFYQNAEKKALHYARSSGLWTLADDSGLCVDALGGAPGVRSARFAGGAGDAANNQKLINALAGIAHKDRTARFICHIVLATADRVLASSSATIEGIIIDQPRGTNGFGYDPHFLVPELGKTTAELDPNHKNSISHRGKALCALLPKLQSFLQSAGSAGMNEKGG